MIAFRSGKVPANGITLHYVEAGEGPPILLIHGWLGTSYHWRRVMPLLAARRRVVALDMRGYGDSDKPYGGYDGLTLAEDLRQASALLGLERPVVVGHDMGALPALLSLGSVLAIEPSDPSGQYANRYSWGHPRQCRGAERGGRRTAARARRHLGAGRRHRGVWTRTVGLHRHRS